MKILELIVKGMFLVWWGAVAIAVAIYPSANADFIRSTIVISTGFFLVNKYYKEYVNDLPRDNSKKEPEGWRQILYAVLIPLFWIAVVIGGYFLIQHLSNSWSKSKEDEILQKLKYTCQPILDEQPTNNDLFDRCIDRGFENFQ